VQKLTPPQAALVRQLISRPAGLPIADCHDMTLTGLVRRGLVAIDDGQVRLTAPTRRIRNGHGTRLVLDIDAINNQGATT
jgi:hypothetical protein